MAKPQGSRAKTRAAPARPRAARPARRIPAEVERVEAPQRAAAAMRLVAEVERLELELAAARARMTELEARAEIDPLTDVLNRRGFARELKRALAYVERYGTSAALIYLDLDGFKQINDRHGHGAGDILLKAIAMVLTRHVRASDVVARLGGDEFALLLWNLSEAHALAKALALEGTIAYTTATHAGATLAVGASAGAAMLLPRDTPADVLARADRAMYARKAARDGVHAAE